MASTFQSALDRYLQARHNELNPRTRMHYRNDVKSLIEFLAARHPEIDSPCELERDPHIEGWLEEMRSREPPYTDGTQDQRLRHVRTFLEDTREWDWPECADAGLIRPEDFPKRRNIEQQKLLAEGPPRPRSVLDEDLERYLDIRGVTLRPSTLGGYRLAVRGFLAFLHRGFPEVDSFSKLERRHIDSWLQMLAKRDPPISNSYRRRSIRSLRRFFEDTRQWGWPGCPPAGLISPDDFPPAQKYLPKPLAPEVDAVLMAALEKEGDLSCLGLLVARRTGLRIGELCRLEADCLTEDSQGNFSLRVPLGKLHREREIPVDERTARWIQAIRAQRGARPPTTDPETGRSVVLLSCNRKGEALEASRFRKKLKEIAAECGIEDRVYPHRLRHTYATEMLRYGVSLPGVMKLLGHTTLKMTLRYVEITNVDLGRDYLRAIDRAGRHYAGLAAPAEGEPGGSASTGSIEADFDRLVARLQARRFDELDPERRKRLQRFVERLRRAQADLPQLLR